MSFRLVPKLVTLNDFEWRDGPYFALFHNFRVRCRRKTIIRLTSGSIKNLILIFCDHINTIYAIILAKQLRGGNGPHFRL